MPLSTVGNWLKQAVTKASKVSKPTGGSGPSEDGSPAQRQVKKRYTPSERAQVLEYATAHGVTAAHEKYAVSRFTIYDWRRKVERAAAGHGASPAAVARSPA